MGERNMRDFHIFRTFLQVPVGGTNDAPHNLYLECLLVSIFSLVSLSLIKYFAGPD